MAKKKTNKEKRLRSGNPNLDPAKLKEARLRRGLSQLELAAPTGVSEDTIGNWENGKAAPHMNNALALADALGLALSTLCFEDEYQSVELTKSKYSIEAVISDWIGASNGLKYRVHQLRHTELGRYARGKLYDLNSLSTDRQKECRSLIKRHPDVSYQLKDHPNIITSLDAFKDLFEEYFWIVDDWVEGITLERLLKRGAMDFDTAKPALLDIASGLRALHEQNIVLRELTPRTIIIQTPGNRAVLTEFELAKLLDHEATVSPDSWPQGNGYRAEDATSDDVDHRADVFSWGRIACHLLLGELPATGEEAKQLKSLKLPKAFLNFVTASVETFRSDRPDSFDSLTLG